MTAKKRATSTDAKPANLDPQAALKAHPADSPAGLRRDEIFTRDGDTLVLKDECAVRDEDGLFVLDAAGQRIVRPELGGPVTIDGLAPADYFEDREGE